MSTLTLPPPEALKPEKKPYEPHGAAWELFHACEQEVLICGSAGGGKSLASLAKLHYWAEQCPGMRGLIVRKTRESLTESALVTFERDVLPDGHSVRFAGGQRRMRQAYHYRNGSTLVCAGLDRPSRTFSSEFDLCFVQEAIELEEAEWESLLRCLRSGKMPYQQLFGDTNPDAPTHWLKRRCDAGVTRYLESRHEDNPLLWDRAQGVWTEFGRKYIEKLDALTGPRKARLRWGKWVQAEGIVYEDWSRRTHLLSPGDAQRMGIIL